MVRLRRVRLPVAVRARLDLTRGERILTTAVTADGTWLVATDRALHVPHPAGYERVGWESVDRATWSREDGRLTVVEAAGLGAPPRRHAVLVDAPGRLVDLVREEVNAAVVVTRHVPLRGDAGFRVVARRVPATDRLAWSVALDDGVDVADPTVRAQVAAEVAALRAELGE